MTAAFRVHYVATAGQTLFTVPKQFDANGDLNVYVNGVLKTFSDPPANAGLYNTTGLGDTNGGSIIFGPPGLNAGDQIIILSDAALLLDQNDLARTLRLATGDFLNPLNPLPDTSLRLNKLLGFDGSGQPTMLAQLTGPKGDKGDKGDTGATGAKGDTGSQGPAGADATHANPNFTGTTATFTSVDPGAFGPTWQNYHNSPSPAAGDDVWKLDSLGRDSALNTTWYGSMSFVSKVVTHPNEIGQWKLRTTIGGSLRDTILAEPNLVTIKSYDDTVTAGPILEMFRDTVAPGTAVNIGVQRWIGFNGLAAQTTYGEQAVVVQDITANDLNSKMVFRLQDGAPSSLQDMFVLQSEAMGGSHLYRTNLAVHNDDSGATPRPTVAVVRDSASPAANDEIGVFNFQGKTTTGTTIAYAEMRGKIETAATPPTVGNGQILFDILINDVLENVLTLARSAATFVKKVVFPAATTSAASMNVPHGSVPTTPNNGDIWTTTAGMFVRINGATVGPLGQTAGSFVQKIGDTMTGDLTLDKANGQTRQIIFTTGLLKRWTIASDSSLESASDEGSDFRISHYNDTGNWLADPIVIDRKTCKLTLSGTTFTYKVNFPAGTTIEAPIKIPHGVPPTTPVNGDMWTTIAGLYVHINGQTQLVVGGLPEAPVDGKTYGRKDGAWNEVLPITGGKLTGKLSLNADGVQGPLNIPPILTSAPIDGDFYVTSTGSIVYRFSGITRTILTNDQNQNISGTKTFTVQALFSQAGTLANPSIGFSGDNNTGINWVSADTFGLVANGAYTATISAAGITMNAGKLTTVASATGGAGLNIGVTGTGPSGPVEGDVWVAGGFLTVRGPTGNYTMVNVGNTQTITALKTFSGGLSAQGSITFSGSATFTYSGTADFTLTQGTLKLFAAGTKSPLNIPPGTDPPAPFNGDIWLTATDVRVKFSTGNKTLAQLEGAIFTGKVKTADPTAAGAGLNIGFGASPASPVQGDIWESSAGSLQWQSSTTIYTAVTDKQTQTISGQKTFSNKTLMRVSDTTGASFNIQPGVAPTTPVNGDVWSTGQGVYAYVNGMKANMTIHVGTTPPPSPAVNDLWVDTN